MTDTKSLADLLWAKTLRDRDTQELIGWLPLLVHLRDTAEVATRLYHHRKSRQQLSVIESMIPAEIVPDALIRFLASLHDVGKAGPNFQAQDSERAARLHESSHRPDSEAPVLNVRQCQEIGSQAEFPHSLASEVIVGRVLASEFGMVHQPKSSIASKFGPSTSSPVPLPVVHQLASVLGAHHGMTAYGAMAKRRICAPRWPLELGMRESAWPAVQRDIASRLIAESGVDFSSDLWKDPGLHFDRGVLSLLSSLVIEADWIASNHDLFPLIAPDEDIRHCRPSSERAEAAWNALGLPGLWTPCPTPDIAAALGSRFALPEAARPRPGQAAAHAATTGLVEPAIVLLEDETGRGKTEAGLLAAENLAHATGASGVLFCLPTQATTNGMFPRYLSWIERLDSEGPDDDVTTALAHGKANLNEDRRKLRRLDRPGQPQRLRISDQGGGDLTGVELGNGLPPDSQVHDEYRSRRHGSAPTRLRPGNHTWLSGRKKRLQADFVIGTVDQLLMAGLRARHLMLRHSGLADKVIVIDEVHASDSTMRVFLRKALVWLGRWGVPVVVLTATLPPEQKHHLIEAYRRGLDLRASSGTDHQHLTRPADSREPDAADAPDPPETEAVYPALTVATAGSTTVIPIEAGDSKSVTLDELDDDDTALIDAITRYGSEGGCIAVIRNSVRRVQATAEALRNAFGFDAVTVAHARFTASDRAERDRSLLEAFGKDSSKRPDFSIVVATSVIEQSLDIDFDLMFTDLCPVDLLIQRIGRVHRHSGRARPGPVTQARCIITRPGGDGDEGPNFPSDSEHIYGRHVLLRTAAALRVICRAGTLTSPDDIASLVHTVYSGQRLGPDEWWPAMDAAKKAARLKEATAQDLAERWATEPDRPLQGLDDWLNLNDGDPEDSDPYERERGSVRDGSESIEVLLVLSDGTGWRTLDWLPRMGGVDIPTTAEVPWHVAEAVANSSIRLPFAMCRGFDGDKVIEELEKFGVAAWQRSPLLRGQLVLPMTAESDVAESSRHHGEDAPRFSARVGDWHVVYDRAMGLVAERRKDSAHTEEIRD
ncbi:MULTISPECIES: CRISPR-associated helicase Cas3' [Brevibacterium]|nr:MULTISPECIES: CRISPR-associated helicase Cas3' [Brevibacterium]